MTTEPIVALESLGYTKREASFLYLVGVHSGYFVRRQFDYFIDRVAGAIAQNFVEKGRVAGHVETIDYGRGYRVTTFLPNQFIVCSETPSLRTDAAKETQRSGCGYCLSTMFSKTVVIDTLSLTTSVLDSLAK